MAKEEVKGIWQQINEMKSFIPQPSEAFTLASLIETIEALQKKYPYRKPKYQMPAHDYPFLTDDQFKAFIESAKDETYCTWEFIGGSEGYKRMKARCERLGIPIDERKSDLEFPMWSK